jgi:glycosyltransferase involved in cell wall biosynthesis
MAQRSLLIVTFHFPPSAASGSFRMLGFARHLPKFGWRALVVAPPGMPWEPMDRELAKQVPSETAIYHVPYFDGRLTTPLRMWAPFVPWLVRAWPTCARAVRQHRPATILTSGPPHPIHMLGLWLKRQYRLPWIADFRDPWIATAAPRPRRSVISRWEERQERAVVASADAIITNAPNARKALTEAFPAARGKSLAITNGYDPERFEAQARTPPAALDQPITILHPGQLYLGRDPRPFFDALKALIAQRGPGARPIRFSLIGNLEGDCRSFDLAAEIRSRGLGAIVSVGGQVPYNESLEMMARTDILLLLDTPGRRIGVPAKLYEYVGAGRPVLALGEPDGDTAWVLRQCGVPYRIAPPGDPDSIRQAVTELVDQVESRLPASASACGRLAFTREHLTGQLAEILNRITAGSGSPNSTGDDSGSDRPAEALAGGCESAV